MGVRNAHYECQLSRIHRHLDQQCQRELRKLQVEATKVEYDYKAMRIETKQNEREQKRRENPDVDTTYEDLFLQKSTKYLNYNPDDCNYLNKKNLYPPRTPVNARYISPAVRQARHLLMEQEVKRSVQSVRDRRMALVQGTQSRSETNLKSGSPPDMDDQNLVSVRSEMSSLVPQPTSILVRVKKKKRSSAATVVLQGSPEPPKVKTTTWLSGIANGNKSDENGHLNGGETARIIGSVVGSARPELTRSMTDVTRGSIVKPATSSGFRDTRNRERKIMACFENLKGTVADETGRIRNKNIQLPIIAKLKSTSTESEVYDGDKRNTEQGVAINLLNAEDDYDVEERLRELGIIKDNPGAHKSINNSQQTPRSAQSRRVSTAHSARTTASSRMTRPILSRATLRKDSEDIQNKIDGFFIRLEEEKEQERLRVEALAAGQHLDDRDDDPGPVTQEVMKQTNLFLSYRSKVMNEKLKRMTSRVMTKFHKMKGGGSLLAASVSVPSTAQSGGGEEGGRRKSCTPRTTSVISHTASPCRRPMSKQAIKHGWRTPSPPPNWTIPRITLQHHQRGEGTTHHAPLMKKRSIGIPGASAERSKRHTATYKLSKMVNDLMANQSKFEQMKIAEAKQVGEPETVAEPSLPSEGSTSSGADTEDRSAE